MEDKIFENKFFTLVKPFLSLIDKGALYKKPFGWLYVLIAVINLLAPLWVFYLAIKNHIFDAPAKFIFAFLFVWFFVVFAGWVSFQIWWNRKDKVQQTSLEDSDFPATPVISHLIQTFGEWLGIWTAIVGFGFAFFSTIFLGEEASYFANSLGLPIVQSGILSMILMPVYGFMIIVFSRFIAEQIRAIACIANNTKR